MLIGCLLEYWSLGSFVFKILNFFDASFSFSWHHLLRRNPFIVLNAMHQFHKIKEAAQIT